MAMTEPQSVVHSTQRVTEIKRSEKLELYILELSTVLHSTPMKKFKTFNIHLCFSKYLAEIRWADLLVLCCELDCILHQKQFCGLSLERFLFLQTTKN